MVKISYNFSRHLPDLLEILVISVESSRISVESSSIFYRKTKYLGPELKDFGQKLSDSDWNLKDSIESWFFKYYKPIYIGPPS